MVYRMTAARKRALRKAQLASARKRRKGGSRKKKIAAGVGAVAVGVVGYRSYNNRVENAQTKHLRYKAWNARAKMKYAQGDDILYASMQKPHKQPRRYRRRTAAVQSLSTIRAVRAKKYGVLGKSANVFGRAITKQSPIKVIYSGRRAPHAPFTPKFETFKYNGKRDYVRVQQRVGKNLYLLGLYKRNG